MRKSITMFLLFFILTFSKAQTNYICFDSDENPRLKISLKQVNGENISVTYKGQKQPIPLIFNKDLSNSEEMGAHPNLEEEYLEKWKGKITGKYIITHSGIWDYIQYTRKDGKVYHFTINHSESVQNGAYRKTPCYK